MKHIRTWWYGLFVDYHLSKQHKINMKYKTIHQYHSEMAEHYYEKAYGEELKE